MKNKYKRKNYVDPLPQITALERQETHLHDCAEELNELEKEILGIKPFDKVMSTNDTELEDSLNWGASLEQYCVPQCGVSIPIGNFLKQHANDPATKVSTECRTKKAIAYTSGKKVSSYQVYPS